MSNQSLNFRLPEFRTLLTINNQYILTKIKDLIKHGASIGVYEKNYTTNSLFEMALEAKREKTHLKIHVRNSKQEDLIRILEGGGKHVTLVFD